LNIGRLLINQFIVYLLQIYL